jgi:hypothetical protein
MNALPTIRIALAAMLLWAGPAPAAAPATVKGVVLETRDAGGYTYLRLKTQGKETWAAVNRALVRTGAEVTIENVMVMTDFESKSLKKTFPTILFGTLGASGQSATGGSAWSLVKPGPARPAAGQDAATAAGDAPVARAAGRNARTVAEVVGQGAQLKDKPVSVRARVVKYNPGIMGRNWLHVRDGSGSGAAGSNDILVTTTAAAEVGEVVTVQGTVRTDRDFGAGYAYKVMIEDATLRR